MYSLVVYSMAIQLRRITLLSVVDTLSTLGTKILMRPREQRIRLREVTEPAEWNAAAKALGGSITQSWEWGSLHQRQGYHPLRLLDEGGRGAVQLLLKDASRGGGSVAYAPYGSLAASVSDLAEVTRSAARWVRGRGAYLLKVEPRWSTGANAELLRGKRYVQTARELPARTRIIGIPEDPEEHLMALPGDARYRIRRARRNGVEVQRLSSGSPDMDNKMGEFLKLLKVTAERHGFYTAPEEFYRNVVRDLCAHLLLAYHEGTLVAAIIVATFGEEAYYLFGASTTEKGNLHAPYLVQWEAMEVARRQGCSRYDMWGIASQPSPRTRGFIQFKQKFGGTVEEYPGAYIRVLSYPELLKYGVPSLAFRTARFAIKTIRSYPAARSKLGSKVSVQRDTGEPTAPQASSSRHQSGGRGRSVKQLITLGFYYITSDAYARAFVGKKVRPFGELAQGPPAPFIGSTNPQPPEVIAEYQVEASL
jgi:hypothetical protein